MSLPAWWYRKSSLVGIKLSNSGEALKLLIPNYIRKIVCGWINLSSKVISQKIPEKIMGNRGSKHRNNFIVPKAFIFCLGKEQRVYGSWGKRNPLSFKIYSNEFRKKLSNQNPFLANIFKVCRSKSWAKPKIGWIVNLQINEKTQGQVYTLEIGDFIQLT